MSTTLRLLASACIAGALAFSGLARAGTVGCPSVAIGSYGAGCAAQFDVPVLAASFDPAGCSIKVQLTGMLGCCNTFLADRIFFIGAAPASVPLPQFGPGCMLLAQPDLVLVFPASAGNTFESKVPPIDATLYVQGVNHYFTTIGFDHDYNFSNGLKVDIG